MKEGPPRTCLTSCRAYKDAGQRRRGPIMPKGLSLLRNFRGILDHGGARRAGEKVLHGVPLKIARTKPCRIQACRMR